MNNVIYSVIIGTGSYIPHRMIENEDFMSNEFYDEDGKPIKKANREIVEKFEEITTIKKRRYVTENMLTSDIAYYAAIKAVASAKINIEELDYIIVAHNFGDTHSRSKQRDTVPSIAARVKHKLEIKNPNTVAYDILFGCPGWLQAVIQSNYFIRSGDSARILVIGAEVLSTVTDSHDRNSMLFADGAGAVVLERKESEYPVGIIGSKTRSDTFSHLKMLYMGESSKFTINSQNETFIKMNGRKLYQYALLNVPNTIKECLDKNNIHLRDIKKVLIHQANGKMDDAILKRLFDLYNIKDIPKDIMPMTISWLGNSSVATIPTLLDLIEKGQLPPHKINSGDTVVLASVGAGMSINVVIYKK
ncbi:MAG: ketoacyl-ACP synthase III [Crocinitomix sp.]|nr:ketoacyl-ACP synthase III [Crocinitomix sp.]